MIFTISFDPLHMIGIVFLAYLASLVGNILAGVIVGFRRPSLDGEKFYVLAALAQMATFMTIPKILVATVAASIAMYLNDSTGAATLWATGISGTVGFLFTLIVGTRI